MSAAESQIRQFQNYLQLLFSKVTCETGNALTDRENVVLFLDFFLAGLEYSFSLEEQLQYIGDSSYVDECLCALGNRKAVATVGLMRMAIASDEDKVPVNTLNYAFREMLPSLRAALMAYARRLECGTFVD